MGLTRTEKIYYKRVRFPRITKQILSCQFENVFFLLFFIKHVALTVNHTWYVKLLHNYTKHVLLKMNVITWQLTGNLNTQTEHCLLLTVEVISLTDQDNNTNLY
jgi:hypothetical protein